MTEKLKTCSEVLEELETAKRIIEGLPGLEVEIITSNGSFVIGVKDGDTAVISGHIKFTPDPDTKIQALGKAHKLQLELTADATVKGCSLTNGTESYTVDWTIKETLCGSSKQFPFADPSPESEFITDEPPPEWVEVEVYSGGEKVLRYSWGEFYTDDSLMVTACKNRNKNTVSHKTYRSLTTPHRSKN